MLKIVMEDLEPGEVAAMYEEDGDAVILLARGLPDDRRCKAVNRLLAALQIGPVGSAVAAVLLLLAHLSEQGSSAARQGFQALGV